MDAGIRLMNKSNLKLTGVAFTMKKRSSDKLLAYKVLDMPGLGDVIVVDAYDMLAKTSEMVKKQDIVKQIQEGKWDRTRINVTLKAKGSEFIEE